MGHISKPMDLQALISQTQMKFSRFHKLITNQPKDKTKRERNRRPSMVETPLTCAAVYGDRTYEVSVWLSLRENRA